MPSYPNAASLIVMEPLDSMSLGDRFVAAETQGNYIDSGRIMGWHLTAGQFGTIRELEHILSEDTLSENISLLVRKIEDLPLTRKESKEWVSFLNRTEQEEKQDNMPPQSRRLIEKMHKRDILKAALDRNSFEKERSTDPNQMADLSILISRQRAELTTLEKEIERLIRKTEHIERGGDPLTRSPNKEVLIASLDRLLSDSRLEASRSGYINKESLLSGEVVYFHSYPHESYLLEKLSQYPPKALVDGETNFRIPIQKVEDVGDRWLLTFEDKYLPIDSMRKWGVENAMAPASDALLSEVLSWCGWKL